MVAKRPSQILSLDEFDEPKNVLVYGPPGCGKTPFGASASNCLILATEPGTVSARRLGHKADVWPCVDNWDQFVKAYRWLKDNPDHGYDWIVIDNATQAQEMLLREIVAIARRQNNNRDEDIPAIQDYQKWYLMFDRFVKQINALPVATLWLAHTMHKVNDEGEDLTLPAIQGQDYKQAAQFCGRMQAVGFMSQRLVKKAGGSGTEYERRILWRQDQNHFAKDRYIFRKDVNERYTIVARGEVERTTMAEISKRIDQALEKKRAAKKASVVRPGTPIKSTVRKAAPAKTAVKRTVASRRRNG
jgi:hypothetical protein